MSASIKQGRFWKKHIPVLAQRYVLLRELIGRVRALRKRTEGLNEQLQNSNTI